MATQHSAQVSTFSVFKYHGKLRSGDCLYWMDEDYIALLGESTLVTLELPLPVKTSGYWDIGDYRTYISPGRNSTGSYQNVLTCKSLKQHELEWSHQLKFFSDTVDPLLPSSKVICEMGNVTNLVDGTVSFNMVNSDDYWCTSPKSRPLDGAGEIKGTALANIKGKEELDNAGKNANHSGTLSTTEEDAVFNSNNNVSCLHSTKKVSVIPKARSTRGGCRGGVRSGRGSRLRGQRERGKGATSTNLINTGSDCDTHYTKETESLNVQLKGGRCLRPKKTIDVSHDSLAASGLSPSEESLEPQASSDETASVGSVASQEETSSTSTELVKENEPDDSSATEATHRAPRGKDLRTLAGRLLRGQRRSTVAGKQRVLCAGQPQQSHEKAVCLSSSMPYPYPSVPASLNGDGFLLTYLLSPFACGKFPPKLNAFAQLAYFRPYIKLEEHGRIVTFRSRCFGVSTSDGIAQLMAFAPAGSNKTPILLFSFTAYLLKHYNRWVTNRAALPTLRLLQPYLDASSSDSGSRVSIRANNFFSHMHQIGPLTLSTPVMAFSEKPARLFCNGQFGTLGAVCFQSVATLWMLTHDMLLKTPHDYGASSGVSLPVCLGSVALPSTMGIRHSEDCITTACFAPVEGLDNEDDSLTVARDGDHYCCLRWALYLGTGEGRLYSYTFELRYRSEILEAQPTSQYNLDLLRIELLYGSAVPLPPITLLRTWERPSEVELLTIGNSCKRATWVIAVASGAAQVGAAIGMHTIPSIGSACRAPGLRHAVAPMISLTPESQSIIGESTLTGLHCGPLCSSASIIPDSHEIAIARLHAFSAEGAYWNVDFFLRPPALFWSPLALGDGMARLSLTCYGRWNPAMQSVVYTKEQEPVDVLPSVYADEINSSTTLVADLRSDKSKPASSCLIKKNVPRSLNSTSISAIPYVRGLALSPPHTTLCFAMEFGGTVQTGLLNDVVDVRLGCVPEALASLAVLEDVLATFLLPLIDVLWSALQWMQGASASLDSELLVQRLYSYLQGRVMRPVFWSVLRREFWDKGFAATAAIGDKAAAAWSQLDMTDSDSDGIDHTDSNFRTAASLGVSSGSHASLPKRNMSNASSPSHRRFLESVSAACKKTDKAMLRSPVTHYKHIISTIVEQYDQGKPQLNASDWKNASLLLDLRGHITPFLLKQIGPWNLANLEGGTPASKPSAAETFGPFFVFLIDRLLILERHRAKSVSETWLSQSTMSRAHKIIDNVTHALDTLNLFFRSLGNSSLEQRCGGILRAYTAQQLSRCLAALWALLEPPHQKYTTDSEEVASLWWTIKRSLFLSWESAASQSVMKGASPCMNAVSQLRLQKIQTVLLCCEAESPIIADCPYCGKPSTSESPYRVFKCSAGHRTAACTASFAPLTGSPTSSKNTWGCSLCGHIFSHITHHPTTSQNQEPVKLETTESQHSIFSVEEEYTISVFDNKKGSTQPSLCLLCQGTAQQLC